MENELFEKTKVSKAYMTLALPVVLGMVVSLIYNMVDTFFIARTGNTALIAGVSLGTPIFTLMIALGDIFGVGGSSVISRLFGKKEYEDGRRISVFCFYAAIAVGIVVSIILLAAKQPILGLLGCDETTWQYAGDYYQWIALGAPFIIVQLTPNNLVRTEGFAKASMIGTMIGAVVNIILDPVFIYTLGLGAAGAAIATVLGNICGDIFYVIFIIKKCRYLSVDFRKLKVTGAEVLAVLAIGIPASVTNFMQSIGVTLTNRFLQPHGTDKVAAMGIALKIIMISVLVMVGFAFGGQPLVGYNYGAKNKKRFNETIRFAFLLEVLTGAGMAIVLGAAAPLLVGLFLKDASVIAVAQQILRVQLIGMPFVGIVLASTCIFQAIGNGAGALILSSVMFGLYHGQLLQGIYAGLLGCLLAFLYERKRTLAVPVIVHASANSAAVLLETACYGTWLESRPGVLLIQTGAAVFLAAVILRHICRQESRAGGKRGECKFE